MRKYLYLTVFFTGITSLAIEMSASRLIGNVFGTSNLVWASIIGLILIYLAVGYFIGGPWADKSPKYRTFFTILIWAALSTALVPLVSRPLLRLAANAFDELQLGVLLGSFTTVMILLCVPIILMGTASPFAIRIAVKDSQSTGRTAGFIYAISTLGSFIGTFLPTLVLIPLIGTYRTFLAFGGLLLLIALIGLWVSAGWRTVLPYLWTPFVILLLAIFGLPGTDKASKGQIFETESSYNYIQVVEQNGFTLLRLNEGQGIHSVYHPNVVNYFGPWEQVLVAPFFNTSPHRIADVKRIAIVGLAAGTTARQATLVYGAIPIDGIEIDPKIVAVGQKYFDMNEPNLNITIQDGRWALANSQNRYSIISVDAYRPPYIPWHLTTVEFFQVVYDHLDSDGVMVINVGRTTSDRRLIEALAGTIQAIFPSVYVMDVPASFNSIIFATVQTTQASNLDANYQYLSQSGEVSPLLLETMQITLANLQPTPPRGLVFTDDLASIEWITNSMVINYLTSPEMDPAQ